MLQTNQLTFSYETNKKFEFENIACSAGESLLILGNSGKGKTTLLHLLAGLLQPLSGSISINETDITKLSKSKIDIFRGQNIGIIFQKSHFIGSLTVKKNLLLTQYLAGVKQDEKRILELLERLHIAEKIDNKTHELSQGEQQRVAIVRALLNRPSIILADEPTASLDDENCKQVIELLKEQAEKDKVALIIVTHDTRLKAVFEKRMELF
ncbi:MAG: ABC transporter ATP-binding protein [Chitinophagales bacterium]